MPGTDVDGRGNQNNKPSPNQAHQTHPHPWKDGRSYFPNETRIESKDEAPPCEQGNQPCKGPKAEGEGRRGIIKMTARGEGYRVISQRIPLLIGHISRSSETSFRILTANRSAT